MNKKKEILVIIAVILVFELIIAALTAIILLTGATDLQIGIASIIGPVGIICVVLAKRHKSGKKTVEPKAKAEVKIRDKEKLDTVIQELQERTKTEYYKIHLEKEPTDLYSSKLGGIPYWDLNRQYPTDSNGNKLFLLAQINFEKENFDDERLPKTGILQFFITDDDWYGCNFYPLNSDNEKNWSIVYHETITENLTEEDIMKLNIPTHKTAEYFPIEKDVDSVALKFEKSIGYITTGDYRFEELFKSILKEKYGENITEESWYSHLNYAEFVYIGDAIDSWGHKMLGYPNFTQEDPRREGSPYDTLLLQIDSDNIVMWGDSGAANFFINLESLKNKDFSEVVYNWDCY